MAIKAPDRQFHSQPVGIKTSDGFGEQMERNRERSNKWEAACVGTLEIIASLSFTVRGSHNLKNVETFFYYFKLMTLRKIYFYYILN